MSKNIRLDIKKFYNIKYVNRVKCMMNMKDFILQSIKLISASIILFIILGGVLCILG